jgi:Protein of unknown function (DUF2281)
MNEEVVYSIIDDQRETPMEQAILDKLQLLPEVLQEDALQYIEALVAKHIQQMQKSTVVSRKNAFGIWQGEVWMADDFDAPLADFQEYM